MATFLTILAVLLAGAIGYRLGLRRVDGETPAPAAAREPVEPDSTDPTEPDRASRLDLERALADLRLAVVVLGRDGDEVYRNNRALQYATGRHGDALVEAALERVLDGAMAGLSLQESVEVYGPPARSLLVHASPTVDDGAPSGAVGVIDDVTEARRLDRVRSDFVANVSHELRTPVGAMSVLAETIAGADDPEVIDRLTDRMQREANRLSETIDDLLALSRLESGPVVDPETLDLVSVAAMAIERTGGAAEQRGVVVVLRDHGDQSVLVDGDQGQLVSAVANLIDNAIKYSEPDGRVDVEIRLVPPNAELSVVDHGIGIPDGDLDRIFERFYRVDSARSRETGGTGLGLSIVRHAALNHGGRVDVVSTEGRGSTFTMQLPLSVERDGQR